MTQLINDSSKPKSVESNEYSRASNELTESEPAENEVQSPIRGASKSRAKKSSMKDQKCIVFASTKRSSRSKQRATRGGYWKVTSKDQEILFEASLIGKKKISIYSMRGLLQTTKN
ncbi:uncharacterized protein LOC133872669 [Alnus glutinosa]|uniref:uncharacterized protein LOC133872669 n=1 Tax=Alnus glutinosa TaxID=3517 RepID=UPI002D792456|nr:uncharacterized protein LOC133872669 [Alnus glutinosa]